MAEPIDYNYSGIGNDTMLTGAETMLDLYNDDVADFTAFDAGLDAAFATQWETDIDAARDYPTDESVVDEISELTDKVNAAWLKCRNHFQDAKYFIEKAFPGNTTIWKTFGYDNYEAMSRDQDKVLPFMDQFHDKAQANNGALITAGYTQAKIDAIDDLAADFRKANRNQEKLKSDRLAITQERVNVHNKVWASVQAVNRASKSVYRNNYAKLQQYLLPGAGSNEPAVELAVKGTFRKSTDSSVIPNGTFKLTTLNVSDNTDLNGKYGVTKGVPAGDTAYEASAPGCVTKTGTLTILADQVVTLDIVLVPV